MKLNIVQYPDKRLKQKSIEVTDFGDELHELLDSMYKIMIDSNGIGLAAIQVAYNKRALILNLPDEEDKQSAENLLEIINPKIIEQSGETTYQEGCLSVPKFYEDIKRYEKITITYQDRYATCKTLEADGLLSIAIQHEIDHLNGILFIDKLSYSRRKKFEKEYKKILREMKNS
jgi:peptide deformylase